MRFALNFVWLATVAGATIRSPEPISYDGYQVHRIRTTGSLESVKKSLATIPHQTLNKVRGQWDVLVAPEHADALTAFKLKSRTLHENLGHSITKESRVKRSWKRNLNSSDDAWFDSYHSYGDVGIIRWQPRKTFTDFTPA